MKKSVFLVSLLCILLIPVLSTASGKPTSENALDVVVATMEDRLPSSDVQPCKQHYWSPNDECKKHYGNGFKKDCEGWCCPKGTCKICHKRVDQKRTWNVFNPCMREKGCKAFRPWTKMGN